MTGTSFSVTAAMRFTPPMKMAPAMTARPMPTTTWSMSKAFLKASLMELAWTMLPMNPRARMMATAKKPARNFATGPLPSPREM